MKKNTKRLINILFYDKKNLFLMVFFNMIHTIVVTSTPYILKIVVQKINSGYDIRNLYFAVVAFFSIGLVNYFMPLLVDRYYTGYTATVEFKLQSDVLKKLYSSSLEFLNKYSISDLIRITVSDIKGFKKYAAYIIFSLFNFIIKFISLIFYVSLINPVVMVVLFGWYFLFFFITAKVSNKIVNKRQEERKIYSKYISVLKDSIQGNVDLRFFGSFTTVIKRLSRIFNSHLKANVKAAMSEGRYNYLTNVCQAFANILLVVMIFVLRGKYKIDAISALTLFSYTFFMFPIVAQLFNLKGSFNMINGYLSSIYSILDYTEDIYKESGIVIDEINELEVKNLKTNNFNVLKFEKNNIYILKGTSGCGKSTFLKKLLRLIDSNDLNINVNGYDLKEIDLFSYYNRIAFIPQDVYLFNSSIYENIDLNISNFVSKGDFKGKSCLSEKAYTNEIGDIALEGKLKDIINLFKLNNLSDRLYDMSGESGYEKVSGGEKKRLGIARAIFSSSTKDLFIFDESFSNIDKETKKDVLKNLCNKYFKNKITIIVSHDKEMEDIVEFLPSKLKLNIIEFDKVYI